HGLYCTHMKAALSRQRAVGLKGGASDPVFSVSDNLVRVDLVELTQPGLLAVMLRNVKLRA
ncbi:hypothetical protein ACVWZ1_002611, partial [Thermostichus sp. MS-CIW-25]